MGGVGADIAALMVAVEDEVHAGHIVIGLGDAHHVGEVGAHVEAGLGGDDVAVLVLVAVDEGRDLGETRHQRGGVLVHVLPVVGLLRVVVLRRELALLLHGQDGRGQHHHRVAVLGHGLQHVEDVAGHLRAALEVRQHLVHLGLRGDLARQQEVPEGFHRGIFAALGLRQGREGLGDVLAAEADAFLGIQVGDVRHQSVDVARPADDLADVHLVDDDVRELLGELLRAGAVFLDFLQKAGLQA